MHIYSVLTPACLAIAGAIASAAHDIASPMEILAQYEQDTREAVEARITPVYTQLDDTEVLCEAPPSVRSSPQWASAYEYPVTLLSYGGDLKFNSTAGPAACRSVACNNNNGAAVYFCNDNREPISVLFSEMGAYASLVLGKCPYHTSKGTLVDRGQAFHRDGWNVFLGTIDPCTMPQ